MELKQQLEKALVWLKVCEDLGVACEDKIRVEKRRSLIPLLEKEMNALVGPSDAASRSVVAAILESLDTRAALGAMYDHDPSSVIDDRFAEPLVRAVGVDFFSRMAAGELDADALDSDDGRFGIDRFADAMAARTLFFDGVFADAAATGVRQGVILASGLDARWVGRLFVAGEDGEADVERQHPLRLLRGARETRALDAAARMQQLRHRRDGDGGALRGPSGCG